MNDFFNWLLVFLTTVLTITSLLLALVGVVVLLLHLVGLV